VPPPNSQPNDRLAQLSAAGVAVWLDDISRDRLVTGNLAELIRSRHVVGVTSNPTIFDHALSKGANYNDQIRDLALRHVSVEEASRAITTFDIRWACDVLRPVYDTTAGVDGRVSLEVDPRIAKDPPARTVAEARALWWMVDRPNLFIKIPATPEGVPAITQCLSEGISVNVTLIFSLTRYAEVIDAFLAGMEKAAARGLDLPAITSVASFFVSRVDTEVDRRLDKIGTSQATQLRGKAAIANARLAYELYEQRFGERRWDALRAAGAHPQRPLWASTSTKDPAFDDTRYVVELVAPGVVNTMPESTLDAVAQHAEIPADTIHGTYDEARKVFTDLQELGIGYDDVTAVLEAEGVQKFSASWAELLGAIEKEMAGPRGSSEGQASRQ
jgi:transaldolase